MAAAPAAVAGRDHLEHDDLAFAQHRRAAHRAIGQVVGDRPERVGPAADRHRGALDDLADLVGQVAALGRGGGGVVLLGAGQPGRADQPDGEDRRTDAEPEGDGPGPPAPLGPRRRAAVRRGDDEGQRLVVRAPGRASQQRDGQRVERLVEDAHAGRLAAAAVRVPAEPERAGGAWPSAGEGLPAVGAGGEEFPCGVAVGRVVHAVDGVVEALLEAGEARFAVGEDLVVEQLVEARQHAIAHGRPGAERGEIAEVRGDELRARWRRRLPECVLFPSHVCQPARPPGPDRRRRRS